MLVMHRLCDIIKIGCSKLTIILPIFDTRITVLATAFSFNRIVLAGWRTLKNAKKRFT